MHMCPRAYTDDNTNTVAIGQLETEPTEGSIFTIDDIDSIRQAAPALGFMPPTTYDAIFKSILKMNREHTGFGITVE